MNDRFGRTFSVRSEFDLRVRRKSECPFVFGQWGKKKFYRKFFNPRSFLVGARGTPVHCIVSSLKEIYGR